MLVKAEVTPAPKDGPVKKAVPNQFPLLERVKGKTSEQLKALEESFQRSDSPTEAELGTAHPSIPHPPASTCLLVGRVEIYYLILILVLSIQQRGDWGGSVLEK